MQIGEKYMHYRNNKIYEIVGFPTFQEEFTGKWVYNAIILYKDEHGMLYIRSNTDFDKKFIKVK